MSRKVELLPQELNIAKASRQCAFPPRSAVSCRNDTSGGTLAHVTRTVACTAGGHNMLDFELIPLMRQAMAGIVPATDGAENLTREWASTQYLFPSAVVLAPSELAPRTEGP